MGRPAKRQFHDIPQRSTNTQRSPPQQVLRENQVENDSADDEPESSRRDREAVDDRTFEGFGGGVGAERVTEARVLATAVT